MDLFSCKPGISRPAGIHDIEQSTPRPSDTPRQHEEPDNSNNDSSGPGQDVAEGMQGSFSRKDVQWERVRHVRVVKLGEAEGSLA